MRLLSVPPVCFLLRLDSSRHLSNDNLDVSSSCLILKIVKIRTIAILPPRPYPFVTNASNNQVRKVCVDYAVTGLKTIYSVSHKPFRFIYVSGHAAESDKSVAPNAPGFMKEYCWIRVGPAHNSCRKVSPTVTC